MSLAWVLIEAAGSCSVASSAIPLAPVSDSSSVVAAEVLARTWWRSRRYSLRFALRLRTLYK